MNMTHEEAAVIAAARALLQAEDGRTIVETGRFDVSAKLFRELNVAVQALNNPKPDRWGVFFRHIPSGREIKSFYPEDFATEQEALEAAHERDAEEIAIYGRLHPDYSTCYVRRIQ